MRKRLSAHPLGRGGACLAVLLALSNLAVAPARVAPKMVTIKATFTFVAPNGVIKPVRYALAELRNSNLVSDDVVRSAHTGLDGSVIFEYDANMSDGWLGGRIDPYVRCYPKLSMPSSDLASISGGTRWDELARVGRGTGLGFIEPVYDTLETATWDDNDSDRTAEVKATGAAGAAFFILDCALTANLPTSSETYRAPMALGDLWVFPGAMFDIGLPKTAYMPDTNVILIDASDLDFDSTLHEYGHFEMCRYYGSSFGSYDCVRRNHSFEEPLRNKWYLPSDAEWSALAEGWADFGPVITKRQPIYHGSNVETATGANLATASASCEGTICRIFWDIADTWQDKTLDGDERVIDRPLRAGMALDDDPMGFAGRPPYSTLPGWDALKDLIRLNRPKSLAAIRDAWRAKYASNRAALRALDAVFWINGVMRGDLQENAPTCSLHLNGSTAPLVVGGRTRDAYVGDVTLSADVSDLDVDDRPFLHVDFYWAYMSERAGAEGRITSDLSQWNLIGVDIDGSDGFGAGWPDGVRRPLPGKDVCLIAVASDFMMESACALALDPANRTGGQIWSVVFGETEAGDLISEAFRDLTTAPAIVAGPHAMVLCDDGTVLSWGVGKNGVLGDGVKAASRTRVNAPLAAPLLNGVVSLSGDSHGGAAARADGTVWIWGRDLLRLRQGVDWSRPVKVEGLDGVKVVSSSGVALAIRSDDTAWGWTFLSGGQAQTALGFDFGKRVPCESPLALPGLPKVASVAAGAGHSLVIDKEGDVWSFGQVNRHGELGRGDRRDKPLPKRIPGLHDVISVAIGTEHCLAACRDGSVWAWGAGDHGALGDGTLETRLAPVRVRGIDKVKAVAAGQYSSFALREDGTVWAWGSGYLGVSKKWNEDFKIQQTAPMPVLNLSGVTAISAGWQNALALCADGSVWAWGTNDWGAIGDGTWITKPLPVKVAGVNVFRRNR